MGTEQNRKARAERDRKKPKASAAVAGLMASADFNTVYVQYNAESLRYNYKGDWESESGNSVSAGFAQAFALSNMMPLYVESGIAAKYIWKNKDGSKFNMLSLKVPVNMVFAWADAFTFAPYASAYLRFNPFGKRKLDDKYTGLDDGDDDMGDNAWKRI